VRLSRRRVVGACVILVALLLAACGGASGDGEVRVIANGTEVAPTATPGGATASGTPAPTPAPLPFTPTPPPSTLDPEDLRGFLYPVEGGCLPGFDGLMPNAPREYRNGVHEGVDWYPGSACAAIASGTPVYAMHDGVVVRADHDYLDITLAQVEELQARTAAQGFTDPEALDTFRGRQVWVDHGQGILTRYAHLVEIPERLFVGLAVRQGELVGLVGESGTPEFVTDPGTELHLHAEVRVGESFLGAGLSPAEVRALYERLFGPPAEDEGAPPPAATAEATPTAAPSG
jgi:murein DD-endopeptidase MepM/ murein hydrolase activator NlpD